MPGQPTQISMLDHPDLIGTASFGVALPACEVALRLGLRTERSFEDLGYFDFLAVAVAGRRLGFRTLLGSETAEAHSYVACFPEESPACENLIAEVCGLRPDAIVKFAERW